MHTHIRKVTRKGTRKVTCKGTRKGTCKKNTYKRVCTSTTHKRIHKKHTHKGTHKRTHKGGNPFSLTLQKTAHELMRNTQKVVDYKPINAKSVLALMPDIITKYEKDQDEL